MASTARTSQAGDSPNKEEMEGTTRLQWSNRADYELKKELAQIARKRCDDKVKRFVDCAKQEGMMVIFRCRNQNKEMNNCLSQYTNDAAFEEYKAKRSAELMAEQQG